jgi:ATP phosphoribosyltransferase
MSTLRIAIQKNGRLSEKSLALLKRCGIVFPNEERKLKTTAENFPLEILFLRDDDIPQYVEQGVADIGILGQNIVWEKNKQVNITRKLGFARCRLSLAIAKDTSYNNLQDFNGKKIATSYPKILSGFLHDLGITAEIEEIGGSVEIATGIGLADAVFDIASTGSTLMMNGLKEVEVITQSEAVLISNPQLSSSELAILNQLLFRIEAVTQAAEHKYILLNAPDKKLFEISNILPGMKSPTILPLAIPGWSSIHSVVKEDEFWEVIDSLKELGAQGILVVPIEKMIA